MSKITDRSSTRRVVVTGLGVISSLGIGWQEFWKNLLAGKSGISRIESFDTTPYDRHFGGEVKNFDPTQFMSKRKAEKIGRTSQMAIAASKLAIKDAAFKTLPKKRTGVCLGTTMGEAQFIEKIVKGYVSRDRVIADHLLALCYPANSIVVNLSNELGLRNTNIIFANACAAGNYAVGYAFDLIRSQRLDYALAGGTDSLSRIAFTGFGRVLAMATEKCRPFDKNRNGILLGEGSGIILLESLESAKRRKAKIYAEVLGYGLSSDAYHMTEPSVVGIAKALQKALKNSGISADEVDYISAHGTGTVENDEAECRAYERVFGKRLKQIPVSSIKSMLGHTMGASSALETIACCLAITKGVIPPTINHEKNDPKCKIDCVPNKGRRYRVRVALNNSQAFGGNNACLILRES